MSPRLMWAGWEMDAWGISLEGQSGALLLSFESVQIFREVPSLEQHLAQGSAGDWVGHILWASC